MKKKFSIWIWLLYALVFLALPFTAFLHAQTKPINNLVVQLSGTNLTGILNANGSSATGTITPSAILATIGATQGDILYYNGTAWVALAPGTATNVLTSGGAGANPSWAAGGGGGTPGGSTTQIQYNSSGSFAGSANLTYSGNTFTHLVPSIGVTSTDGNVIGNSTAAANGAQQWSPRLHLYGNGWTTGSGGASKQVDIYTELRPIQGVVFPSFQFAIASAFLGGTGTDLADSDGSNWSAPGIEATNTADATGVASAPMWSLGGLGVAKSLFIGLTLHVTAGSNLKAGTFTLNSGTPVVVSNTAVTVNSVIHYSPKPGSISGTITAYPWITAATAGASFTVNGSAGDASIYNYWIEENH